MLKPNDDFPTLILENAGGDYEIAFKLLANYYRSVLWRIKEFEELAYTRETEEEEGRV